MNETIINMLKAQAWETAKGAIRAFVSIQGSYPSTAGHGDRWTRLGEFAEGFITTVEDEALHE